MMMIKEVEVEVERVIDTATLRDCQGSVVGDPVREGLPGPAWGAATRHPVFKTMAKCTPLTVSTISLICRSFNP